MMLFIIIVEKLLSSFKIVDILFKTVIINITK